MNSEFMKLVINKCYGGFSLSAKAVKRLAELSGKECYFFTTDWKTRVMSPVALENADGLMWRAYTVPNPDEVAGIQANWNAMSDDERRASNARWEAITLSNRPDDRNNPLLVQTVEELGAAADGMCAELKIIEIPDGTDWEIDEYDGMESVHEKHASWA